MQEITTFLKEFVPRNTLHISKLKSYKNNVAEQNEQIKQLTNEILELVQVEEFDKEINSSFLGDCNWTRTHNHLVLKRTLNHLAKLTK